MKLRNLNMEMIEMYQGVQYLQTKNYLQLVVGQVFARFGVFQIAKWEQNLEAIMIEWTQLNFILLLVIFPRMGQMLLPAQQINPSDFGV